MKILAVDDDPVFLDILGQMLRAIGQSDIVTASSGAGALALLKSPGLVFDSVLLDIQMPGMTGIELCHAIRSLPDYRRVPIVMITSMSGKHFIDGAFAAGATDYVTKPLERTDLMARIGMVTRLVEERQRNMVLTRLADRSSDGFEVDVAFDTALLLPGFERSIDYLALENYLLTLGMKGILSQSALGIHIINADLIFSRTSRANFVGMLGDVGSVIADVAKTDQLMLAYAGSGDFVGVAGAGLTFPPQEMEMMINIGLADFEDFYASEQLPLPQVRLGSLVKSSLLSLGKPARILERAVIQAQLGATISPRPKDSAA